MTPEQILKIIEKSFDENISVDRVEHHVLGPEYVVSGKDDFMKQVKDKLDRLELINKITA